MNYRIVELKDYYRRGVFEHFSKDCKCSVSITARIDVTDLAAFSKKCGTRFYLNFLYLLSKVLNSRDDYKLHYFFETNQLAVFDKINPTHYVFFDESETCTPVYTEYTDDYKEFYDRCIADIEVAKQRRTYLIDSKNHQNYFDASFIPWASYDALNIELPDGYLYFSPIVNWGKYREENGRLMMPVTVRLNHAAADGYTVSKVFSLLECAIKEFVGKTERT